MSELEVTSTCMHEVADCCSAGSSQHTTIMHAAAAVDHSSAVIAR